MAELNDAIAAGKAAIADLIGAAERSELGWAVPRAPGKWSSAQIVEHCARALEESANVVAGRPSKFPTFPGFVRPVVRGLFFKRVLKKQGFPKARTVKAFDPANGPPTVAEGRARLEGALAAFERECRARLAAGQPVESTIFGSVPVADYAEFQAIHIRHHSRQIPTRES
jgi:hypothetical protein